MNASWFSKFTVTCEEKEVYEQVFTGKHSVVGLIDWIINNRNSWASAVDCSRGSFKFTD